MRIGFRLILVISLLAPFCRVASAADHPSFCNQCVRADEEFLASDELHGRGSATRDEHIAAIWAASQFQSFGLEPGGDNGSFLQKAPLPNPLPDRVKQRLAKYEETPRTETWNAVAILRGSDSKTQQDAILLTAHLDHLGIGPAVRGDSIYNGADDDASGTTAVIELARIHPPVPLDRIVTNLEFEMIGRPDPAAPAGNFWLTGYERSNLGHTLAKHGAHIVGDPHPDQKFFQRSDNYALAKRGIIAQTISSFNLHKDYHQPSDEISKLDFPYMTTVISSMVRPIQWLANTDWKPAWNANGKP
jgi:hypothetical protein